MSFLKINIKMLLFITLLFTSITSYADVFTDILNELEQQTNLQTAIQQSTAKMSDLEQQTLQSMIGNYGYGNYNFNSNLQSWGVNTNNWSAVLNSYQQNGSGVSQLASQHNQQFPIQPSTIANPNSQSLDAKYYTLQAQTALAARAASEYDYNNIQNQITYLQQLQSQIDKTTDIKAAIDLNNRLQYETAIIQVELLRLMALTNQQQAISTQGDTNAIVNNANAFR